MPQPVLDLNLATRPFRNNTPLWLAYGIGLFAVVALGWWNYGDWHEADAEIVSLQEQLDTHESRMARLRQKSAKADADIARHDLPLLRTQTAKANDVIERKAFSWTRLFQRLESVLPNDVRMESIRPLFRVGGRRSRGRDVDETGGIPVLVEGSSKGVEPFFAFETALLDHPYFDRVEPQRLVDIEGNEWVFEVRFYYYPEGATLDVAEAAEAAAAEAAAGDGAAPPADPDASESDDAATEATTEPAAVGDAAAIVDAVGGALGTVVTGGR